MYLDMSDPQNDKIQATFVMEQHVGHRTFYENMRRFVSPIPQIESSWVEVTYSQPNALVNRIPGIPASIRGTLAGRAQVRKGLRKRAADVTVFNTQVPAALGGGLLKRPYILCTDITPLQYDDMAEEYEHTPDKPGAVSRYKHQVNLKVLQGAARLLPWSNWTRESLIQDYGVSEEKIEVLPPGVDTDIWQPSKKRSQNKRIRILFVGGDFYRKGGEVLLKAFQALPAGMAELVLVTRSPISSSEHISVYRNLSPNSAKLIDLYHTSNIFVLPTRAEAFGIAAIEASATGLPVIGTAVGGLSDIVLDGKTGFLVEPDNVEMLRDRLQTLITDHDLRHKLGQAARKRAEICFDARKNALRVAEILEEVVAGDSK